MTQEVVKALVISRKVVYDESKKVLYEGILECLQSINKRGVMIALLSNQPKPTWFETISDIVGYVQTSGRQKGLETIGLHLCNKETKEKTNIDRQKTLVVGVSKEDLFMASNSHTFLIRGDWADVDPYLRDNDYGIPCETPLLLTKYIDLFFEEPAWYASSQRGNVRFYSLINARTFDSSAKVIAVSGIFRNVLKANSNNKKDYVTLWLLANIYATPELEDIDLWGYYPSSIPLLQNQNDESILSQICRKARQIFKKRIDKPLFIRHMQTQKRHTIRNGDKWNPNAQLRSIHLNPELQGKISGKKIAVLDDFMTNGVSFGIAYNLLKQAGAREVVCISLGSFMHTPGFYSIQLPPTQEIFSPMSNPTFEYAQDTLRQSTNQKAQALVCQKFLIN